MSSKWREIVRPGNQLCDRHRLSTWTLVSLVDSYELRTIIAFLQTRKPQGICN